MASGRNLGVDGARDEEFERAFERIKTLIDWKAIDDEFTVRGNAVYISSVVLLMLLYQRMRPDKTLDSTVKALRESMPELLPDNVRVRENKLSTNNSAYAKARQRLPLAAPRRLASQVSEVLIGAANPSRLDRRVFFFDGTTMKLAPEPALRKAFPPASNQHGDSAFPVALLAVAYELESGAAVLPVLGAMYGESAVSETALVGRLFEQLPPQSVVMGDAGFGIFVVAHDAHLHGHDFLLRLTAVRFRALKKQARLVSRTDTVSTWSLRWRPSHKERQNHPRLSRDAVLDVFVHEVRVSESLTLFLVTSLPHPGAELADLYRHRNDVEIDIRNFKVTVSAETTRVRSVDMFEKELWMSVTSYNLVCQFRREAAKQAEVPSRKLSFKRVLTTYNTFLSGKMYTTAAEWRAAFDDALQIAMQDKLPHRPNRRFPREAYQSRPKSAQFQKRPLKTASNR